jgi:hypothetical protein
METMNGVLLSWGCLIELTRSEARSLSRSLNELHDWPLIIRDNVCAPRPKAMVRQE